jgi:hypothetical protein
MLQLYTKNACFGKPGISQFGATFLMSVSSFDKTKLEEMLGEERTKGIKPGDMVVFTAVLYNADANQDWLHSLVSLYALVLSCFKKDIPISRLYVSEQMVRVIFATLRLCS